MNTPAKSSSETRAFLTFLGCSAFEMLQKLHLYPGTYDPRDFLAYGAGATCAYAIERISFRALDQSRSTAASSS